MLGLPSAFSLKAIAIAAVVAWIAGFGGGVWVRDAFCDAAASKKALAEAKAEIAALETARDRSIEIQTRMAARASELRLETEQLKRASDDLAEQFRAQAAKPAAADCGFSDAERQRVLRSIPIGPVRRPNP
ncbi:hypothetical protein [Terrarubrum flagellatum]|uniref:hypothetical protein n=1 Tax=Terrirubrum flagellatum TaxID=2895980 RepID=UPI003144D746